MFNKLLEIIKKYPVQNKILLQSASMSGTILIDRICREQGGVINLRPLTVQGLALQIAEMELSVRNLSLLPDGGGSLIIQNILPATGYYKIDPTMPGLPESLWNSIAELRLAGLPSSELRTAEVEPPGKSASLADLLDKADAEMARADLIDWPGVLHTAIAKIGNFKEQMIVIIPGNLSLTGLEKRFVEMLPCEKIYLPFNAPDRLDVPKTWRSERIAPQHIIARTEIAGAELQKQVKAFLAPSFDAEARELIRRIRSSGQPWEEIEIALGKPSEHGPIMISLLDTYRVGWAAAFVRSITETRIGRLADHLSAWARDDFPATGLLAMLEAGEIGLLKKKAKKTSKSAGKGADKSHKIGRFQIATMIRNSHAIGGRDGYEKPLAELCHANSERGRDDDAAAVTEISKRLKELLKKIPDKGSPGAFALGFSNFFKEVALPHTSHVEIILAEQAQIKRITALCDSLKGLREPQMERATAMHWLNRLIQNLKYTDGKNCIGRVLITAPGSHGLSGRKHVYFAGMVHSAIPGIGSVDPVLNDNLREVLQKKGCEINGRDDHRRESMAMLTTAFAGLKPETIVCISASENELDKRAASVTHEMVRIIKRLAAPAGGSFADLRNSVVLPVCTGESSDLAQALDAGDLLRSAGQQDLHLRAGVLMRMFPSLQRFKKARTDRRNGEALVETGLPEWQNELHDPRITHKPVSISYLNSLSGCNFAQFLQEIIRCMPFDQLTWQEESQENWLDHMQRGSLLHEIFEKFLKAATWPVSEEQRPVLNKVVAEVIERYRTISPPPDLALFNRDQKTIADDADFFFELEKQASASGNKPIGFEVSFGMPARDGSSTSEESSKPVALTFADGSVINLRGKIDRIDQGPEGLTVIDYKTGRASSYREDAEKMEKARQQLAVYALAATELARRKVIDGKVAGSCLYFPTNRGAGEKIPFAAADAEEFAADSAQIDMFNVFTSGSFPAMISDDCLLCNAWAICPFRLLEAGSKSKDVAESDNGGASDDEGADESWEE